MQLRGYERFNSGIDGAGINVAHVMLVRGPSTELLEHLPVALVHTLNLHPRLRALQVHEPTQYAEIQPFVTIHDVKQRKLLRIRDTCVDEETKGFWKTHIQQETMIPFDRYNQLPVYLDVWADRDGRFTRLFLFSDHYMTDGSSGRTILHDLLTRVAQLSRNKTVEPKENELLKGPYALLLEPYTFSTALAEFAVRILFNTVRGEFCSAKPLLPIRSDQADFVFPYKVNPSYAQFGSGKATNVSPILTRCKQEHVTYTGALTAAVVLAYCLVVTRKSSSSAPESFKLHSSVTVNLRQRFPTPIAEDAVGNYASLVTLDPLRRTGVSLELKFWDVARQCKASLDAALRSPLMAFTHIALDQAFEAASLPKAFTAGGFVIPKSITGDVTISNMGRYPHALTHSLGSGEELTVDSLHVYESVPNVAVGALVFVATTDKFNYAMVHKHEDGDASELFQALTAFAERIGEVGPGETMADVFASVKRELDAATA